MKSKILSLFLLTAILSAIIVLAATANPSSIQFINPDEGTTGENVTLNLVNSGATYDVTALSFNGINFDVPSTIPGKTTSILIKATSDYDNLDFGVYKGEVVITEQGGNDTVTIPVEYVRSFCDEGERNKFVLDGEDLELEISNVDIKNKDGDDEEWVPLDRIEVEVEVSNDGDDRIKDVTLELGLIDSNGKDIINDMEDLDDEKVDLGSITEGKEDTFTYTFTVPADFEDGSYKLIVKAYSDDNDIEEENLCVSESSDLGKDFFEIIDGVREEDEDKHIIFHDIRVSPNPAQCNEIIQITGEVVNIGDDDYEDQILVTLFSPAGELNINMERVLREDFDEGDEEQVDFEFELPGDTTEGLYTLEFRTHYEYDDGGDDYDIRSDTNFIISLRVAGNCQPESKKVEINAQLDSETPEAVAGKQVIINTNLRNTGDKETTYTISVSGNVGWSSLVSIEPQVVTLSPGESRDINVILSVNSDAQGDNELVIKASSEGVVLKEQRVSLPISSSSKGRDANLGPFVNHIRDNWFIYLIVLVNIVLIVAIILVIRSMVSPRPL